MSYTLNQILISRITDNWYLSQFLSEMFDLLEYNSTKCAPQYELNSFVTMTTYWVPDLLILKAFLATFSVPLSYLQMVPPMHNPAGL